MKVDCRPYFKTLKTARNNLIDKCNRQGALNAATSLSCYTHIPLIVIVIFLMQDNNLGPIEELNVSLKNLINFYGYDQIIPFD
jgi:hypothetical protein